MGRLGQELWKLCEDDEAFIGESIVEGVADDEVLEIAKHRLAVVRLHTEARKEFDF